MLDATEAVDLSNYTIDGVDLDAAAFGAIVPTLSTDKKSVTFTFDKAATFKQLVKDTTYRVGVKTTLLDKAGNPATAYDKLFTFTDTAAPTVVSSAYTEATKKFAVKFSEPLDDNTAGGGVFADLVTVTDTTTGAVVSPASVVLSADGKTLTVDGAAPLTANSTYRVVILGAKDLSGNYFAGNKVDVSFKVAAADTVAPTVTSMVANADGKTVRVVFSEPVFQDTPNWGAGTLAIDGAAATTIQTAAGTGTLGNATDVNGDGKTFDITVSTTATTGSKRVEIQNVKDLQGNPMAASFSQFVTFASDTAAPALQSSSVAGTKLYLTFNEDTLLANGTATVLTPDNVQKSLALVAGGNLKNDGSDKNVVVIDLSTIATKSGSYKVTLPSGIITDAVPNSAAYEVTVNVGVADSSKPTLKSAAGAITADAIEQTVGTPSEVTVRFSEDVSSSALNVDNYKVNGASVFTSAVFSEDLQTVKLTVRPGAIDTTGNYLFTVSGVKDIAGNTMDTVSNYSEALIENVAPTLTAKLTNTTSIALTFSEAVGGTDAKADFEVYVDGAKVATADYAYAAGVITLTNPVDVNKTVVVKVVDTIADAAGNTVAKGDVVVSK